MNPIKTLIVTALSTGIIGSATCTWAQGTGSPEDKEARRAEFLAQIDLDGDGQISRAEAAAAREARHAEQVAQFMANQDLDGNGAVTLDELILVAADKAAEKQAEFLARYDLNGNGTISADESLSVHQTTVEERLMSILERMAQNDGQPSERPEARRPRPGQPERDGERPNLDADGDGSITEAELMAAAIERVTALQDRFNERHDANGDGNITPDEIGNVDPDTLGERVNSLLERMDANGDGQITADEVTPRQGRRGGGPRGPEDQDELNEGENAPAGSPAVNANGRPRPRPNNRRGR